MIVLDIPDVPPSPNRLRGVHWAKKKQIADYWKSLVRAEILPGHVDVKQQVKVTLCHARLYDKDNAYASCKPVLDALKTWKLIVDDSEKWLVVDVEQKTCPHKQRHTIIEISAAVSGREAGQT